MINFNPQPKPTPKPKVKKSLRERTAEKYKQGILSGSKPRKNAFGYNTTLKSVKKRPSKPNKRSGQVKATSISENVRKQVLMRDGGCIMCYTKKDLHVHHVVPRSVGGMGIAENLISLCVKHHNETHGSKLKENTAIHKKYLAGKYPGYDFKKVIYKKGVDYEN